MDLLLDVFELVFKPFHPLLSSPFFYHFISCLIATQSTVKVGSKRIFLFTNDDAPNSSNKHLREQSFQRAKVIRRKNKKNNDDDNNGDSDDDDDDDAETTSLTYRTNKPLPEQQDLAELGIEIELFSMNRSGHTFDPTIFYQDIISLDEDEVRPNSNSLWSLTSSFTPLFPSPFYSIFLLRILSVIGHWGIAIRCDFKVRRASSECS